MAYQRYGGYQYETSPRKIQPEYDTRKRQNKNVTTKKKTVTKKQAKPKMQLKAKAKALLYIFVGFSILFAISYRNSQITETFNEKEKLKEEVSAIQKENEQLQISIENSMNLNNIEQLAKERLGMQKLNNDQKIYVSLDKKDYIEAATEEVVIEESTSLWDKIVEFFTNLAK